MARPSSRLFTTFIAVICLIFITKPGIAQPLPPAFSFYSDTSSPHFLPIQYWEVLPDPGQNFTLPEIIHSNPEFTQNRKVDYGTKVYWQRFRIYNQSSNELEISLPQNAIRVDLFSNRAVQNGNISFQEPDYNGANGTDSDKFRR